MYCWLFDALGDMAIHSILEGIQKTQNWEAQVLIEKILL